MFVDRESELNALDALLRQRGPQFAVVYGRRRVGKTSLLLEWAHHSGLPFLPDGIGRHWSQEVEIDVAAINWPQRHLLLGECKWGTGKVGRNVIRSLVDDRGPRVLSRLDGEWQVHYAFFARTGFTAAALREAAQVGATTATLAELDRALVS